MEFRERERTTETPDSSTSQSGPSIVVRQDAPYRFRMTRKGRRRRGIKEREEYVRGIYYTK
jgi:hypothetical protein